MCCGRGLLADLLRGAWSQEYYRSARHFENNRRNMNKPKWAETDMLKICRACQTDLAGLRWVLWVTPASASKWGDAFNFLAQWSRVACLNVFHSGNLCQLIMFVLRSWWVSHNLQEKQLESDVSRPEIILDLADRLVLRKPTPTQSCVASWDFAIEFTFCHGIKVWLGGHLSLTSFFQKILKVSTRVHHYWTKSI